MADRDYSRRGILDLDDVSSVIAERELALRKDLLRYFRLKLMVTTKEMQGWQQKYQTRDTNLHKRLSDVESRLRALERR